MLLIVLNGEIYTRSLDYRHSELGEDEKFFHTAEDFVFEYLGDHGRFEDWGSLIKAAKCAFEDTPLHSLSFSWVVVENGLPKIYNSCTC